MTETIGLGIWSLLPPVVIVIFALKTRKTFEALFIGTLVSYVMFYKLAFFWPLVEVIQFVIADEIWIFVAFALFGFFVVLLERSEATTGFANLLARWADTQKKALIATWVLGIIVFMDDFLNILTVSAAMKKLLDKLKTPREMLAYVLDSTGAPICVLIPLSTWAIFYAGLGGIELADAGVTEYGSGMSAYISAIPFMFYSWVAVIMVPLVSLGIMPKIGPMKKAFERVDLNGRLWSEASDKHNRDEVVVEKLEGQKEIKPRIVNFVIPLGVVIVAMLMTEDMVASLLIGVAVMFLMYVPTKTMSFDVFCDSLPRGINNMLPVIIILVGCYTIREAMYLIEMPQYVIELVLPYCNATFLPMIAFFVVAILSFVTGSSWGVPAITVPILLPLAFATDANFPLVFGAVVTAASFGSHACFYADSTVLASQASQIDNIEHCVTQLPYVLISAGIAGLLFLIAGFIF